jgi:hypothetical protein
MKKTMSTVFLLKNKILKILFPNLKMKTMNKVQKILVDYSRFINAELVDKVQTVIDSLTASMVITTPQPTIAQLQTGLDDLSAAMAAANTGGKEQRVIRDQKRADMIALMKQEAQYVTMVANGDVATMLNAGFDVSKISSPIGPLPKPVKFKVTSPQKGWLQLSLKAIRGAKNYQYEYRKVGDTLWTVVPSSKAKIIIQGLESVTEYIARVLPVGTSDEMTYSDEITGTVI